MDKRKKLAQIADLATILEGLVKEYNDDVDGYEAHIADIYISTKQGLNALETEIHLHGNTDNIDIGFSLIDETRYDTHIIKDYGSRFHGVHLTDTQFEWFPSETEGGENASMAI